MVLDLDRGIENRDPVISVRGLYNSFGSQVVHENLDLDFMPGEIIGIVGGSGTGKSVLLKSIIGLIKPLAGEIRMYGLDPLELDSERAMELDCRWGVLFQDGALFTSLTVAENVQVPLREHAVLSPELMDELAALKIRMVGLPEEAATKMPAELSGGMRKRAGLARAVALDPDILFLDEPTAGLDPIGAAAFDTLIKQLQLSLGLTVFLVTHDLDTLHSVCDRIAVLADKRVLKVGTLDDMLEFDHPWVREYFHGPRSRAAGLDA